MKARRLSEDELIGLCLASGIRLDVLLSYVEAEAVHRSVDVATIVRMLLFAKPREVGAR